MEMGHLIAKYRMEKGLSQKELGKILNVSTSTVALWETDKRNPTPLSLIDIADYFNISMDDLFSADRKNTSYLRTQNPLPPECERLIGYWQEMNEESREILMGRSREILREQRLEEQKTPDLETARRA